MIPQVAKGMSRKKKLTSYTLDSDDDHDDQDSADPEPSTSADPNF